MISSPALPWIRTYPASQSVPFPNYNPLLSTATHCWATLTLVINGSRPHNVSTGTYVPWPQWHPRTRAISAWPTRRLDLSSTNEKARQERRRSCPEKGKAGERKSEITWKREIVVKVIFERMSATNQERLAFYRNVLSKLHPFCSLHIFSLFQATSISSEHTIQDKRIFVSDNSNWLR